MFKIPSEKQNKVKRMKRTEAIFQRPLGQYQMHQHSNYRGPRRKRVQENFWRDYGWKVPQHGKGNSQSRVPYRIKPRRNMPRHILIKLTKTKQKERIVKAAREKQQITYKGNPIRLTVDLSTETLQARREWQDIFKVLKGKNLPPG